jgi:nitrogen regulatory protein P-II 1
MKEIKASIQQHVLSRVIHALHELPHFPGLTVIDVAGQGRGRGRDGTFELTEDNLFFHRKKMIEMIADDAHTAEIVECIRKAAHTGTNGDGIIVVTEISSAIRIRTGEVHGEAP